jgi:monofunctional biosynthetic peptidoglycan transglycosylase
MLPSSRRKFGIALSVGACGLALALWIVTPPSGIGAFARGAPETWAKLEQVHRAHPALKLRHTYVPLRAISPELQLAVIVGEDADFFGHGAWDPQAVREALEQWLKNGRLRGASTLTQQLAKNLFLTAKRSLVRKAREARYAYWLEKRLGKLRILELYLNVIELGNGIFGVEAGAQHYFGVSAAALDDDQAAQLAAAIPSPDRNNPATRTRIFAIRYEAIRERMERFTWLREELLALAGRTPRAPALQAGAPGTHAANAEPEAKPQPPAATAEPQATPQMSGTKPELAGSEATQMTVAPEAATTRESR